MPAATWSGHLPKQCREGSASGHNSTILDINNDGGLNREVAWRRVMPLKLLDFATSAARRLNCCRPTSSVKNMLFIFLQSLASMSLKSMSRVDDVLAVVVVLVEVDELIEDALVFVEVNELMAVVSVLVEDVS